MFWHYNLQVLLAKSITNKAKSAINMHLVEYLLYTLWGYIIQLVLKRKTVQRFWVILRADTLVHLALLPAPAYMIKDT